MSHDGYVIPRKVTKPLYSPRNISHPVTAEKINAKPFSERLGNDVANAIVEASNITPCHSLLRVGKKSVSSAAQPIRVHRTGPEQSSFQLSAEMTLSSIRSGGIASRPALVDIGIRFMARPTESSITKPLKKWLLSLKMIKILFL